jgi:predicted MPP superfamily phosphohydrolase
MGCRFRKIVGVGPLTDGRAQVYHRTMSVRPPSPGPPAARRAASSPRRRYGLRGLIVLIAVVAGLVVWLFVEPRAVTVAEYRIASPDVPEAFDGTRVVFLSDIHHGPFLGRGRLRSLVDRVNAMVPDVVILGGDYVHGSDDYIEPCFRELSRLHAPLGVYAVLGNHDHWEGAQRTRAAMAAAGIQLLDNRGFWIDRGSDRLRIAGVGDLWEDRQLIDAALGDAGRRDLVLLVSHNPDYYAELLRRDAPASGGGAAGDIGESTDWPRPAALVDLVLAGHTHGGQVTLFGLWAPKVPSDYGQRFRSGLVNGAGQEPGTANAAPAAGQVPMIVSNGIGTITPPVRFCAPPQIVYVELERRR